MAKQRIGGSFAPPLTAEQLDHYESLSHSAPDNVGDGMRRLVSMLRMFWETPESTAKPRLHPVGVGYIVDLEDSEIERIWDVVPWLNAEQREKNGKIGDDDCDQYSRLFDVLQPGELRNAAFHLLWYARELANDREPMTNDKL